MVETVFYCRYNRPKKRQRESIPENQSAKPAKKQSAPRVRVADLPKKPKVTVPAPNLTGKPKGKVTQQGKPKITETQFVGSRGYITARQPDIPD